jgi:hypothetical protein
LFRIRISIVGFPGAFPYERNWTRRGDLFEDSLQRDHAAVPPTLIGSYRSAVGWGRGRASTASLDASFELLKRAR